MKRANAAILASQVNQLICQTQQETGDRNLVAAVEAIAPVLKSFALQQEHTHYFVQQVGTRFVLSEDYDLFAYSKKAMAYQGVRNGVKVCRWETISLLFQVLQMEELNSLVFDQDFAQKIERQKLYNLCQSYLSISRIA